MFLGLLEQVYLALLIDYITKNGNLKLNMEIGGLEILNLKAV